MSPSEKRAEARWMARRVARGQLYCRDARKPEMTGREYLNIYRRWYAEGLRLLEREA